MQTQDSPASAPAHPSHKSNPKLASSPRPQPAPSSSLTPLAALLPGRPQLSAPSTSGWGLLPQVSEAGRRRVPGTPRICQKAEKHRGTVGRRPPLRTHPRELEPSGAQAAAGSANPVPAALSHLSGGRAGEAGRRENPRRRERLSSRWLLWDRSSVPGSSSRPSAPSAAKPSPQSRERRAAAPPPSALPLSAGHAPSRRPSSPPFPPA